MLDILFGTFRYCPLLSLKKRQRPGQKTALQDGTHMALDKLMMREKKEEMLATRRQSVKLSKNVEQLQRLKRNIHIRRVSTLQ